LKEKALMDLKVFEKELGGVEKGGARRRWRSLERESPEKICLPWMMRLLLLILVGNLGL